MILLQKDEPIVPCLMYNSRALNEIASSATQFAALAKDLRKEIHWMSFAVKIRKSEEYQEMV